MSLEKKFKRKETPYKYISDNIEGIDSVKFVTGSKPFPNILISGSSNDERINLVYNILNSIGVDDTIAINIFSKQGNDWYGIKKYFNDFEFNFADEYEKIIHGNEITKYKAIDWYCDINIKDEFNSEFYPRRVIINDFSNMDNNEYSYKMWEKYLRHNKLCETITFTLTDNTSSEFITNHINLFDTLYLFKPSTNIIYARCGKYNELVEKLIEEVNIKKDTFLWFGTNTNDETILRHGFEKEYKI